jgi:phage tail-like protein
MANYYPPVGFHFTVKIEGLTGDAETRFQSVSGLSAEIGTETLEEGGENRFSHRLPTPAKYNNLVLKRGMLIGTTLIKWFERGLYQFEFNPTTIIVSLLNPDHQTVASWNFVNAYPIKWQVSDLDATQNQIAVETVEFSYQYFTRTQ